MAAIALTKRFSDRRPLEIDPVKGRILYVLHKSLPDTCDGYSTRSHGLAQGILALGADLICVTRPGFPHDLPHSSNREADDRPVVSVDGVDYHRLAYPRRSELTPQPEEQMIHGSFAYIEEAANRLKEAIRHYRPSCVVAASNLTTAAPACLAARALGLPFVYEVRGFWEITRESNDPGYLRSTKGKQERFIECGLARAADHVITLTTPMQDELVSRGVDPKKISVAPNACDPERLEPTNREPDFALELALPPDIPVIGYVGSFNPYEGLEDLLRACGQLRRAGTVFRILLAGGEPANEKGDFPLTERLKDVATEENLDDWLVMPGRVPHGDVSRWYSLVDIAPFPRKSLPVTELVSPLKPLEAMAMAKAVIASNVGGMREIVEDGRTGLIIPNDDTDALAEALRTLVSNALIRRKLAQSARSWVESERSWHHSAQRVLRAIDCLSA